MNEIMMQSVVNKFSKALENECLLKSTGARMIGLTPIEGSYLFNKKYWKKLGEKAWNKTLDWTNSGQSLVDYSKKHGKFMPCAKNQKDVSMESKNVQNTPEIESKCPKNEGIQEDRKKDALIDAKIQNRIPIAEIGNDVPKVTNALDWIRSVSSKVTTSDGSKYHYIPFWFKELSDGKFEIIGFDKLPEELINTIKKIREKI